MVRPIRRVVAGEDDTGKAVVHSDAPSPTSRSIRRGRAYASTRLWVTDTTPARVKGLRETLQPAAHHRAAAERLGLPRGRIPAGGVLHQQDHRQRRGGAFRRDGLARRLDRIGRRAASLHAAQHTFDFCYILEGEITLVLDTEEVHLKEGDTVIQRGTNHAWSNRSGKPCLIVFSQHDGKM